jgi:hypothetical protein
MLLARYFSRRLEQLGEDFEISVEDFADWLNNQEAGIVKLKAQIQKILGETKPSSELPFDVCKIKWQDRENEKGKFRSISQVIRTALSKFLNEA